MRAGQNLVGALLLLVVLALVLAPMAYLILGGAQVNPAGLFNQGWTLAHYQKVYTSTAYLGLLWNSLKLAAVVTFLSTAFGTFAAWVVARTDAPWRRALDLMMTLPLAVPPFVGAMAWVILAGPRSGYLNQFLNWLLPRPTFVTYLNVFSFMGMVWCMCLFFVPFCYNFTVNAFRNMNPDLEHAAEICGSSTLATLRRITVPLMWPAIISAVLYIFVLGAEMFSIPGLLGAQSRFFTLSYAIYLNSRAWPLSIPEAAAGGTLLLLVCAVGIFYYHRVTRIAERFVTVGGRVLARPRRVELGPWKYLAWAVLFLYFLCAVVLPFVSLLINSLLPFGVTELSLGHLAWKNFTKIAFSPQFISALLNTLTLGVITPVAALLLGLVTAYAVQRTTIPGRRWLDAVVALPIAIPGIVFATGVRLTYIGTPVYATIWILFIAYLTRQLTYSARQIGNGLLQMDRDLESAAEVCGASRFATIRRVVLPLLGPALTSGGLFIFLAVVRELSSSIMLFTARSNVLSVLAWNLMFDSSYNQASVVGVIQTLLTIAVYLLVVKLRRSGTDPVDFD